MKQWANTGYYKKRQPTRNMRPKVYMELVDGEYIIAIFNNTAESTLTFEKK